ncbi:MAG: hypothetical protein K0Q73_4737, partial [Paenibacillus sp.]|nr:hypothetical protein [Paenibacillus sp.]
MANQITERELTVLIKQLDMESGKNNLMTSSPIQDNLNNKFETIKDGYIQILDNRIIVQAPSENGKQPWISAEH